MRKNLRESLLQFLLERSTERWNSGELQRIDFRNKDGSRATPRSIVRRLQELAEEGKIVNVGTMAGAVYTVAGAVNRPKKEVVEIRDGVAHISYV